MAQDLYNSLSRLILISKDKDFNEILDENIAETLKLLNLDHADVFNCRYFDESKFKCYEEDSIQWKFVSLISYILLCLENELQNNFNELLSVNFQKCIKASLEFVVPMGILPTLIPGIGVSIEKRSEFAHLYNKEDLNPMQKYDRLKSMCNLFDSLSENADLKTIIYANFLKDYLAALYQLGYAPIVKPGVSKLYDESEFTMTDELWNSLQKEQVYYRTILDTIISKCYRPLIIRELLVLQGVKDPPPPTFMRKVLSRELSTILVSKEGLLHTMRCFFDGSNIDIGSQWKHIDMIKRLISVKHGSLTIEDYLSNICNQMKNIIESQSNNDYIIVTASCTANLYEQYPENESILEVIYTIIKPLLFTQNDELINGTLLLSSSEVNKLVRSLDLCFNQTKLSLPAHLLAPIVYHIFGLRVFCPNMKNELDSLLLKHFMSKNCRPNDWFDTLIFKKAHKEIIINEHVLFEATQDGIQTKYALNEGNITVEAAVNCILEILEERPFKKELAHAFYVFCLTSLMKLSEGNKSSKELLINEDETCDLISKESEYLLILLKTLEKLTGIESVLDSFKDDPSLIVEFIISFLNEYSNSLDKGTSFKNEECVMICLMLFSLLLGENPNNNVIQSSMKRINLSLSVIKEKCKNDGILFICNEIDSISSYGSPSKSSKEITEFEKAVNEICDPLLPVRAHGMMHLTKLIEEKDVETISKKHYVQCIFEENLKSDDSYIYLTAINGLAALANYSTEDVLEVLTREFSDTKKELKGMADEENDAVQVRMKIGEVLVKVTKNLGDMAANHKSLLLNTFLCGCKDSDPLLRASSLSNLAEVSNVLSYKLGPVLYEMLNCINSILETDKSQECRRASVLVVSSLLKGLGREALYFLREALLPIYRTLKKLYSNEAEDHTVRLHAQIALEELNNIVRGMIFSPVKLEKKIVIEKPL